MGPFTFLFHSATLAQRCRKSSDNLFADRRIKTKRKEKRKQNLLSLFLPCTPTVTTDAEKEKKKLSRYCRRRRRTTRAYSRADVDDYFIDLFAPCWPLLLGLAVLLAPRISTQMRHLAAVPELAIAALFVMELAGLQCLQG